MIANQKGSMDALHTSLWLYEKEKFIFPNSYELFIYILVCYFRLPPLDVCVYAFGGQTKIPPSNPLYFRRRGVIFTASKFWTEGQGRTDLMQKSPLKTHSHKRVGRTSLWTINFSVFRRTKSCKVILSGDWLRPNPSKIYSSKGACSFRRIDFFLDEPKFLRNIPIFKRISAMYKGKSIF